ncbi:unnamed protein product [Adineta ricciae]|uniref:Uncharacterized protein n=1 Tax=Adineta ricciae TaxID=249248 RepID=A0A815P7S5_ADIRI|nr:unnamed protein product [Adineta ricciae]CAF1670470.1 unnamed protein product [Adineta ricciae]
MIPHEGTILVNGREENQNSNRPHEWEGTVQKGNDSPTNPAISIEFHFNAAQSMTLGDVSLIGDDNGTIRL